MTPRLECIDLTGGWGSLTVFRSINLSLDAGTIHTLLGPNGAGKTTLLLTLSGLLPAHAGAVTLDGVQVPTGRASHANKAGIVLVPDNRELFATLTVEENLKVASIRSTWARSELRARSVSCSQPPVEVASWNALRW